MGVLHCSDRQWFCQLDMVRGDVWLFDTQCNPHAAVKLEDDSIATAKRSYGTKVRESAEVRVLILKKKS